MGELVNLLGLVYINTILTLLRAANNGKIKFRIYRESNAGAKARDDIQPLSVSTGRGGVHQFPYKPYFFFF